MQMFVLHVLILCVAEDCLSLLLCSHIVRMQMISSFCVHANANISKSIGKLLYFWYMVIAQMKNLLHIFIIKFIIKIRSLEQYLQHLLNKNKFGQISPPPDRHQTSRTGE